MKYLGIDFGTKKIGLAVSDEDGKVAFPKEIISNDKETLRYIVRFIEGEQIGEIVVGRSVDGQGNENEVMKSVRDFIGQLSLLVQVPVHLQDEQMTTLEALKSLKPEKNVARKRAKRDTKHVDAHAAALILQRYLDSN